MSLRIPGGEETIWLRTTHFLMACNGCILVSTYHFLHFCSPPVREEEAERAETPSCVARKHRISRTQVSSPKHHSSISTSPHISTTPEPVQSRRSRRGTARLVPRPRHRLLLHEHGIRLQRSRRWSNEHVFPHGTRLPNHRAQQESLPRNILSPSSAVTGEYHGERGG
jgi:hypothetical protein